jgi:hypothetical protein
MPSNKMHKMIAMAGSIAGVISAGLYFIPQTHGQDAKPSISSGNNSVNTIGNGNVSVGGSNNTLNIKRQEKEIPEFHTVLGWNKIDNERFNDFMMNNDKKVVKIDVSGVDPEYMIKPFRIEKKREVYLFTVFNDPKRHDFGGCEYLIKSTDGDDYYYDQRETSHRLTGYFKITGIQGPQQGYFSIEIKPVSLELLR